MKLLKSVASAFLAAGLLAGCSSSTSESTTTTETTEPETSDVTVLRVGATTSPHGIILEEAKKLLADDGIELDIVEFSDYPNINPSTSDGSLDANYFQHSPYLESYNADNDYESGVDGYLVSAGAIHYEPLGLYSEKYTTVEECPDGATIAIPNDATNEARALYLLQDLGLITLSDDAAVDTATVADITENPKNLQIEELAADQIANVLPDVDYAVINGNYALSAGVEKYLIAVEADTSDAAQLYQNVIAVKESNLDNEAIKKLVEVLRSDDIKDFISEEFGTMVVPAA